MDVITQQYEAACTSAVLFDLSGCAKVELAGADARSFLQNLCTNDIKGLPEGGGCEAFLTTAKARVVAHVFVAHMQLQDQWVFLLDSVPGQADALVRHLDHYLISEQVEIADRSAVLAMHRVVGPGAQALVEQTLGCNLRDLKNIHSLAVRLPDGSTGHVRRFDELSVPAFDVFSPTAAAAWTTRLDLAVADPEVLEILRVEAGLPAFGKDMDETRLVMEVGRTAQAICYTKGCFLGQEPIVMARDRGQINRRLGGVVMPDGDALPKGTRLFKGDAEVGEVTSSVRSPRVGQAIALAYLKRGFQEPGLELTVGSATGTRSIVAQLPFIKAAS
jgi:folate-binding protein YgfZ